MKQIFRIILIFFFLTYSLIGQNELKIDTTNENSNDELSLADKEFKIGMSLFTKENYSQAVSFWQRFVDRYSGTKYRKDGELRLSESYMFVGDYANALEVLVKLETRINLKTKQDTLLFDRVKLDKGICYYFIEEKAQAIKELLAISNSDSLIKQSSYAWLNDIFVDLKSYKEVYNADLNLISSNLVNQNDLMYNLGLSGAKVSQWEKSLSYLNSFIDNSNNNKVLKTEEDTLKTKNKKKNDKKNKNIENNISVTKKDTTLFIVKNALSNVYWNLKYYDKALEIKKELYKNVSTEDDTALLVYDLFRFTSALKRNDEAEYYYNIAMNMKNFPKETKNNMALSYADDKYIDMKYDDAYKIYNSIINNSTDSSKLVWANFQLGNIERIRDNYNSALEYYQKVIKDFNDTLLTKYSSFYVKTINLSMTLPSKIKKEVGNRKNIPRKKEISKESMHFIIEFPDYSLRKLAKLYNFDIKRENNIAVSDTLNNVLSEKNKEEKENIEQKNEKIDNKLSKKEMKSSKENKKENIDFNNIEEKENKNVENKKIIDIIKPTKKKPYTIQIIADTDYNRIVKMKKELEKNGIYPYILETKKADGTIFFRLRYGAFQSTSEADVIKIKIKNILNLSNDLWIDKVK